MPPNRGTASLSEDNFLAIVAYILESNTFPPSKDDTLLTTEVIEDIIIARRGGGESKGLANFALVQIVGCLSQGPDKQWRMTNSSQPVTDERSTVDRAGTGRRPEEAVRQRHVRAAQRRQIQAGDLSGTEDDGQGARLHVSD